MSEQPTLFNDPDRSDVALRQRVDVARKQRRTLLRGWHPISGYPLNDAAAPVDNRNAPGLRCRDCFFAVRSPAADVFKCAVDEGRYIDHTVATDLRLWFPACDQHIGDTPLTESAP